MPPEAPTCRVCGTGMSLRTAKQGSNAGGQFWGCHNFPRCRETLPFGDDLGGIEPAWRTTPLASFWAKAIDEHSEVVFVQSIAMPERLLSVIHAEVRNQPRLRRFLMWRMDYRPGIGNGNEGGCGYCERTTRAHIGE